MTAPKPTDVFSQQVQPALNQAREVIASVGLRRYRVFLYTRVYVEPGKRGGIDHAIVEEIRPTPKVQHLSPAQIAASQGLLKAGSVRLLKIRGDLVEEQLRGKTVSGDDLPETWHFSYALLAKGARAAELYRLSSDPVQHSTEWTLVLRPLNEEDAAFPAPPDVPSVP